MNTLHGPPGLPPLMLWFCVLFTAIGVVFLVCEVLLRGVKVGLRLRRAQRSAQDRAVPFGDAYDDPEEGRRMPPLQYPAMEYHTYLGFVPKASVATDGYCTNRYHFRYSEDFPVHKPSDEIRIFITGGSKAWGAGVTQTKLYTHVMEQLFECDHAAARIRVICAAGSAYCSVQERIMVENCIVPLAPDYIVLFSGRNDCYFSYAGKDIVSEHDFFGYRRRIHQEERTQEAPYYDDYALKLHYLLDVLRSRRCASPGTASTPESVPPDHVVHVLLDNIHSVNDIAKRHNCTLLYYLEPSIFCTVKRLSLWEQSIVERGEKKFQGFPAYNRMVYSALRVLLPQDAQENNYLFLDGDAAIQDEERSVFVDNVHFGDRGYRLVAQHMFQKMRPLLQQ